jgi:hypothetical protein
VTRAPVKSRDWPGVVLTRLVPTLIGITATLLSISGCGEPRQSGLDLNEVARALVARIDAAHSPRIRAAYLSKGDSLDPPSVDVVLQSDESTADARELFCTVIGPLFPAMPDSEFGIEVMIWDPSVTRVVESGSGPCSS